jgi:hypothetical protein
MAREQIALLVWGVIMFMVAVFGVFTGVVLHANVPFFISFLAFIIGIVCIWEALD